MPGQGTDKKLGTNDHKNIDGPAGPVQTLSVGGGKEEVMMDDTAASLSQLDGERTPDEMKTSPIKPKKMRYDTPETQQQERSRSRSRRRTHNRESVSLTHCPHSHQSQPITDVVKIATLNINVITSRTRVGMLEEYIRRHELDIFLQEITRTDIVNIR